MARLIIQRLFAYCVLCIAPCSLVYANNEAVQTIIDEHWQWTLESYPELRHEYGDPSGNRIWTDVSPSAEQQRHAQRVAFAERLESIEGAQLNDNMRLNRSMLLSELRDDIAAYEHGMHLMPINMRSGPQHRHRHASQFWQGAQ